VREDDLQLPTHVGNEGASHEYVSGTHDIVAEDVPTHIPAAPVSVSHVLPGRMREVEEAVQE
jgi:hypothetical protein